MKTLLKTTALVCVALLFLNSCEEKKKDGTTKDSETTSTKAKAQVNYDLAESTTTDTPCACDVNWFPHTQTPAPAEGANSPFAAKETTNCIFHQWSWQKFLWLTVPDDTAEKTPFFLRDASIKQVDPYMKPVTVSSGTTVALFTSEAEQAGSSAILETNPNFNANGTAGTVLYAIYMNDTMFNAATTFAKGLSDGSIPASNTEAFPVGSFELKTSWVSTAVIPETELANYYTTKATLDGNSIEVALLGMHVVGVVENHPEFIWATFEHVSMAPAFDWTKGTASADTQKLLFKEGSVSDISGITWTGVSTAEEYTLFEYGVPRIEGSDPTKNFMTTSQPEPENYNHISEINACVSDLLTDVWINYAYDGSIWINTDGLTPAQQIDTIKTKGYGLGSATPGSVARGSLNSANVSMETYTQTFEPSLSAIDASNLTNCLSCHNAPSFSDPSNTSALYISHVFDGYLQKQQGSSTEEVKKMKVDEFKQTFFSKKDDK
ncbi:hypothetical protein KORDIASMS9_04542 [Kordia sp. SMS9]|uniref:hypothetical protein n=1 Tax=Kordia sp. SMS9 TaxID=2282170 RepID=UPI000E0D66BD|nr:hypothetical protein [Kordia sp. SMS9]AXG72273.1 hypothetical protein KORDIASMS9_04542 [Kordia sp. SMS9]